MKVARWRLWAGTLAGSASLRWLLPVLVCLYAYGMQRSVALLGLDLHHDSFMFDAASRMLSGEVPFHDFFYQYNLGTVYLHTLSLIALGDRIVSLKLATAAVYGLIALLIYMSAATHGRRWAGLVWALLWSSLSPFYMPAMNGYHAWSTVYMMAAILGGALLLSIGVAKSPRSPWWPSVGAGICFNLAFWFKQVAGLQILFVIAWLAFHSRPGAGDGGRSTGYAKLLIGFIVGGIGSAVPFFAYILDNAMLTEWWRSAFHFNGLFALTGKSSSDWVWLLRTFLPVARDLGYLSVLWAMVPLYALVVASQRESPGAPRTLLRSDRDGRVLSLFLIVGFAGWAEYFPLAHSFHTQLFMAPIFVVLALHGRGESALGRQRAIGVWALSIAFLSTSAVAGYEVFRHLRGLRAKLAEPRIEVSGNSVLDGLKLQRQYERSFDRFYRAFVDAKREHQDWPLVPLSVDPLRALLPASYREPAIFKMGVDWSWPNEIVEAGFNLRLSELISTRKAIVYADSLIAIEGYFPVALLEMPSPITKTHTLYLPSADEVRQVPPVVDVDDLRYSIPITLQAQEPPVAQTARYTLVPWQAPFDLRFEKLQDLHVASVRMSDIPDQLSALQFEQYLVSNQHDEAASSMISSYTRSQSGAYRLMRPIDKDQVLAIGKFMLSRGKLFEEQNRPLYCSSLSAAVTRQPILVSDVGGGGEWKLAWQKGRLAFPEQATRDRQSLYLAVPEDLIARKQVAILYVEAVMRDQTTKSYYIRYLPK